MTDKEKKAVKLFINFIEKFIIMNNIGTPLLKEALDKEGKSLIELGYDVLIEEPSSFKRNESVNLRLIKVTGKKEREILDYPVNLNYTFRTLFLEQIRINQLIRAVDEKRS